MVANVIASESQLKIFLSEAHQAHLDKELEFASRNRVDSFLIGLDILESKREPIISQVIRETGKHQTLAESEFNSAISFARQTAFRCFSSSGDSLKSSSNDKYVSVYRVPMGPAVLISSYNTPMPNLFWKLSPSFLAGNSSLLCPSPHVAKSFQMAVECLYEAGIKSTEVAVTNGDPRIAELATKSPHVKLISFTGSNQVGQKVSINCAPNHPRLILELGGTNPCIVMESACLDKAARASLMSAFSNGGQRCAAGSVAIIQESVYDSFLEEIKNAIADPNFAKSIREANTPLISPASAKHHDEFVDGARLHGSEVVQFYSLAAERSAVPAMLTRLVSPLVTCSTELFSPVLRVVTVPEKEAAIRFANQLPLRLTSAVWTGKVSELNYFKNHLNFGLLNFNGPTFGAEPNFPFGGMGTSGNGSRDAGFTALESYSQTKIWTMVEK